MQLRTFRWDRLHGWSLPALPDLDSKNTFCLVFGCASHLTDSTPLRELARHFGTSQILGCSTAGEIFGTTLSDDSLAVAVMKFEQVGLKRSEREVASVDHSQAVGRAIAEELASPDLRAVFLLSDGLCVNGSELVNGMNAVLSDRVIVTGGLAADGDRFQRTWVWTNEGPQSGRVTAVGFYGNALRIGHGSKGGWDPFGPERRITKSEGNVLYEVDGKKALELYKSYLGDRAAGLPATALLFPLALRASRDDAKTLVRTILSIDEATQSMTFAGNVPEGHLAQLMRANLDRIIDGAADAAAQPTTKLADSPGDSLAIAISCVGRRLILGEHTEEEIEATRSALPEGTQQIGFYSYGEISPYATGHCDLHNQTMTLTTIGEVVAR